jgi:hypothetical protein
MLQTVHQLLAISRQEFFHYALSLLSVRQALSPPIYRTLCIYYVRPSNGKFE